MHTAKKSLLVLLLVFCLMLTGCSFSPEFTQKMAQEGLSVPFDSMQYSRPDLTSLQEALDHCVSLSASTDSVDTLMDAVYDFYKHYDGFYTNYVLSEIHYNCDLSDTYWEEEYNYCLSQEPYAESIIEQLFYALAASALKEDLEALEFWGDGFFDDYCSAPLIDETLLAMMEQESNLIGQYYALEERYSAADYTLDDALFNEMAELYIQLIRVRQEMADYLEYPDYPTMAYDLYYYRDYTPEEAIDYITQIGNVLYEPYFALSSSTVWEDISYYCKEAETYHYMRSAAHAMGDPIAEAFDFMDNNSLYDINYAPNKLDSSYEIYIWDYFSPFVFMNAYCSPMDKLTFAHEFGHFSADYACDGTYAGVDIAEVHSQAMEYLSLCYTENTELLTKYKLANSLCIYVEQAAYALFEHQVYHLQGDELTVENVSALYQQVGEHFGFPVADWDPRDYVTVLHFFSDPLYVISYVVSNDIAMQFYQKELETPGAGLALYKHILTSQESYLLAFSREYGLANPLSPDRLQTVADLFVSTKF